MAECCVCGLPSPDGFDHEECVDPEWFSTTTTEKREVPVADEKPEPEDREAWRAWAVSEAHRRLGDPARLSCVVCDGTGWAEEPNTGVVVLCDHP